MKVQFRTLSALALLAGAFSLGGALHAAAEDGFKAPDYLITPDELESSIGTLEFNDGAPTQETADKAWDALDFNNALSVYLNSYGGASAHAIHKGFLDAGIEDNTVLIFETLMDSKSLFLTANADTVYYLSTIDLSEGPMVIEQPSGAVGTINDMWFTWIIDIGAPGPDRGEGGRYLIVPPGYDGPLPEGGFFIANSRTDHVLYAARAYLKDNVPKPAVDNVKANLKIYPYTPGGIGSSIAQALEGGLRLEQTPPAPEAERRFSLRHGQCQRPGRAGDLLRRRAAGPDGRDRHRQGQGVQARRADAEDPCRRCGGGQRDLALAQLAAPRGA
jgi:hypothetical protein